MANRKLNWNGADFTGIDEVQLDGTSGLLSHAIISEEKRQRKTEKKISARNGMKKTHP